MTDFAQAVTVLKSFIETKYSIPIKICDVLDPNTGDFDGEHIYVDFALKPEDELFVLIHLFGHTVQWNTSEQLRAIGLDSTPGKTQEQLTPIFDYERDATRYGLRLLHDGGIDDLDRWASDWFHADWSYLSHFYLTGEKTDVKRYFRPGEGETLTPLDIPPFKRHRWSTRFAF
jgi:hypothetical protein